VADVTGRRIVMGFGEEDLGCTPHNSVTVVSKFVIPRGREIIDHSFRRTVLADGICVPQRCDRYTN